MAFTYLIGWSHADKWYIGSRWAKGCAPSDLWSSYFTSSKYVKRFRKEHGEPDVIEVGQVFDSKKAALAHEVFLLKANRAKERECFLNKAVGGVFDPSDPDIRRKQSEAHRGKKQSAETIEKRTAWKRGHAHSSTHAAAISQALKGKGFSEERKAALSLRLIGNTRRKGTSTSERGRENIRLGKLGVRPSEETRRRMSESHKGVKFPLVECPHCGKVGGETGMKSWHFSNCKFFKE